MDYFLILYSEVAGDEIPCGLVKSNVTGIQTDAYADVQTSHWFRADACAFEKKLESRAISSAILLLTTPPPCQVEGPVPGSRKQIADWVKNKTIKKSKPQIKIEKLKKVTK